MSLMRVLVTAAGKGIGRAVAEAFLETGARVHACDVDASALRELEGVTSTVADVADPAQVDDLFEAGSKVLGGLDVLVNNAGISGPIAPTEHIEPADWTRTIEVNLNGHFYCARRAVPLLKQSGGGSIVNVSSTAGLFGFPRRSPYVASKWAIIGLTKTMAAELGPYGIRVNAVCPGSVAGARIERVIADESKTLGESRDEVRRRLLDNVSMRAFIEPRDVASMILFLCSESGSRISGQALAIDGNTESVR